VTNSEAKPLEEQPQPRSRHWLKSLIAIGGTVVVVGGVAGWVGWRELQKRLPGMISEELSGALGRPIKLGELQRFGFTGLRFGETILPPTAEDFTWARVQATDIALNPWDLILRRTFRPSLLLIRPEVSIKQRFDRTWVLKPPDSVDDEGKIKTEIGRIRIRNGEVAIGPVSRQEIIQAPEGFSSAQLIVLENVNLSVAFRGKQNELVALNLGGRLKNGTFRIKGDGSLETGNTNLTIQGKKLRIDTINPFLGGNLFLGEGYGYANVYTEFRPQQDPPFSVDGAARLQNGEAVMVGLPSHFEEIYGRLQFRGQSATFDDTDLRFGPIEAQVRGSVSLQDGFHVGVEVPDVSLDQVETAFDRALPIQASGRFALQTALRGPLREPRFEGRLTNVSPVFVDRLGFSQVSAIFSGDGNAAFLDDFRVIPSTGGRLTAQGQIDFDENVLKARGVPPTALNLTANADLPLTPLAELYNGNLPFNLGRLTATAQITGPLFAPEAIANWQLSEGIAVGAGRVDYADNMAAIANTRLTVANSGTMTAAGQADLSTGLLDLNADARLPLDDIVHSSAIALPAGLTLGILTARANATGSLLNPTAEAWWQLQDGSVPGQGRLLYADQVATIRDTTFDVGGHPLSAAGQADLRTQLWSLGLAGNDLRLDQVSPQLVGTADVGISASGSLTDLTPGGMRATGDIAFSAGMPLAIAGTDALLDGPLALNFDWDGQIFGIPFLRAPGLAVSGQVATISDPVTGFPAPSDLAFDISLDDYDLACLNPLLPAADYGVLMRGNVDFDGTLDGTLNDPAVQGTVALRDTAIGSLALLSDVRGPIEVGLSRGASLDLVGEMTTLQADVGADWLPVSFLFQNGPVLAQAQREGDWLRGKIRDFPLDALGIRPIAEPDLGVIGGTLRSDFEVQMSTLYTNPTARASFGVNRPALGHYAATALQGGLRLANGRATLNNTVLDVAQSRFDLAAATNVRSPWAAEATVSTTNARIEDILAALQLFEIEDLRSLFQAPGLGTAADLETTPIATDPHDLAGQIQQATAARARQLQYEAETAKSLIPALSDLAGPFSADVSLTTSEPDGVAMTFDIHGQDWVWGQYAFANQFMARGALQDQVLTLAPIRVEAADAFMNLEGVLALEGFDAQLAIANVDLAPLAQWLELPLPLQGNVNALASLKGSPDNPALRGTITVDEAAFNDYPLTIGSDFSYRDAWFRFEAKVKGEPDEPLQVQGQVPYALPFMSLQPDSDELLVHASLGSGGFALIDMFSPYVAWGGGDASLLVEAKGPMSQLDIVGLMEFQEASITSEFLGESLTALNGSLGFVGDRLQVQGLEGTLLDGQFALMGELPFLTATAKTAPARQPLTLTFDTLQFNFQDEIVSELAGAVIVSDSLQSPVIGGEVALSEIQVRVGQQTRDLANSLLFDPGVDAIASDFQTRLARIGLGQPTGQFDDFQVVIPDVAKIGVYPLLRLEATGAVTLSGPFVQPQGSGYIELVDGWVNTVTTELFLVTSDRQNLITLNPNRGFNPYIDLLFQGDIPLQRRYDLPDPHEFGLGNTSEVPDLGPLASVTLFDEILITARVEGYASQGFDVLSLSSTPSYPEERLLSILTGGYLTDLPQGEPILAAGTNAVFSLFAEQQDAIGDALGLRRLRLGATTTLPGEEDNALFGVGLGVNVGITDSFSAGLVQMLNRNQPYQLNLQYRINNHIDIGGSTDFSDESRIFMQYRVNF
jgi:translocation and assembly module TamB